MSAQLFLLECPTIWRRLTLLRTSFQLLLAPIALFGDRQTRVFFGAEICFDGGHGVGFNVWGPSKADPWPLGRPRGAGKGGLVYICIYVYTGVGVDCTELVVGWYSVTISPARICGIAGLHAYIAEQRIERRSAADPG